MKLKSLFQSIIIPLAIGAISGLISMFAMKDFASVNKPPLSPPGWVFPVVWTILYILMGLASYYVVNSGKSEETIKGAISLYAVQLFFNFFWSPIFFNLKAYFFAFVWLLVLLVLVIRTTMSFYKIDKKSGYLMIPYILWCIFALYLNFGIFVLN